MTSDLLQNVQSGYAAAPEQLASNFSKHSDEALVQEMESITNPPNLQGYIPFRSVKNRAANTEPGKEVDEL
ncbi:unnamed protein product [Anisakis simplex]|uniref:Uncharacterized protein n=1 Tax=Anisakis simplex TaxID=6269 RepID=A0A0M3K8B4_ANISI|nr:unnamed protein product [Anisakis simplex]